MDGTEQDKRGVKRISFIQDVEVVGVGMRRCSDISVGGMYLEGVDPYPVGAVHKIRFKLENTDAEPLEIQVSVLYIHPGVGAGLSFTNIPSDVRERLEQFITQQST